MFSQTMKLQGASETSIIGFLLAAPLKKGCVMPNQEIPMILNDNNWHDMSANKMDNNQLG